MDKLLSTFNLLPTGNEKIGTFDFSDINLLISAVSIAFNPIFWNIVARLEYRTHFLTRIFGSPYYGCYFLAVTIFSLGILRDHLYITALDSQPLLPELVQPARGAILIAGGNILVLSSMWALGVTGTYLGDYFGILMDHKVEGFPFNVTGSPMYWGSTANFLGWALIKGRPAGVLLSVEVFLMYWIALKFEDPFTAAIYAKKNENEKKSKVEPQPATTSATESTPKQKPRRKAA